MSTKTVTQGNEIRVLESQVIKLKSDAPIDGATIDRLRLELEKSATNTAVNPKPVKAASGTNSYDGNAKGFKAALVSIVGNDNNRVSAERKRAYTELNIQPMGNGKLKSDDDRLAVYEWLKSNA